MTAKFTVNKPATGHTTGYQEDIAQLYTTETTYLGRHYMNFFHDDKNRDASGHHTVWGMAFGYDNNTRGGLQYDHKGDERMTLWSSYGEITFAMATNQTTARADQADIKMRITNAGNLGVGITSPGTSIHMKDAITNPNTISTNMTIPASSNSMMAGPITLTATVTIPSGSSWTIV